MKPVFYRRYVDNKYSRRKKNRTDQLNHELNNYHPNINPDTEINPKNFFDTEVNTKNGKIEIAVYMKRTKLPVPWSLDIPKWCKTHTINANLHRSKQISTNFDKEIYRIKKKFLAVD